MYTAIPHFIHGKIEPSQGINAYPLPVFNPASGLQIAELYNASPALIAQAINNAKTAFIGWSKTPVTKRTRVLFKYKQLLEEKILELAEIINQENGKTFEDAKTEVLRGIEVVEFACGMPHLIRGNFSNEVATEVDSYSLRQPLGICVGLTPVNFPAMVPMWMFPLAIACGNVFILKPSEKVPTASIKLAELFSQAGLPDGVLQILQGDKFVANILLEHPDVQAISFVGSTPVAKHVYTTGTKHGKRVQALGGAKNHCVIMPDANLEQAVNGLVGSAFGAAGQRCMAVSVAVVVGDKFADTFVNKLINAVKSLDINNISPIQSTAHRDNIILLIKQGIVSSAKLILDGRVNTKSKAAGFFLGPSVFDYVTADMDIYRQEIFGPVLCIMRVDDLETAIKLINNHQYGNGAAIYTQSGEIAREFTISVQAGMVGVNIPIPVPMAFYSFGGWKQSMFGNSNVYGLEGVNFYTKLKTVTVRWPEVNSQHVNFVMPTS